MFASIILCQDMLMRSLYMACRLFAGHDRLRQPVKNAAVGSIPCIATPLTQVFQLPLQFLEFLHPLGDVSNVSVKQAIHIRAVFLW